MLHSQARGQGPPLLLVHAGIADGRMWNAILPALARDHRVVVPDLHGFGSSPPPAEPFAHHEDLAALLDELELASVHVMGASLGGAAAIDLALARPDLVGELTLISPAVSGYDFVDPWLLAKWEEAEAVFAAGDAEGAARVELETWLAGPQRLLEELDPRLVATFTRMLLDSYALQEDADEREADVPALGRLAELSCPTRVVTGDLDVSDVHAIAESLLDTAPHAVSVRIERTAHLPCAERPEAFLRELGIEP